MLALLLKAWEFITSKAGEWLAIVGSVLTAIALIRKSGADSVRYSEAKQTLKDVEKFNEIDAKIANMSDDDALNELHSKWQK